MGLYDHFRKEELPFVERSLEILGQVERTHIVRLTDFLDPRQFAILRSLTSQVRDVKVEGNGGYPEAERVRALVFPEYITPAAEDFGLALVEIKGDQRFVKLQHRDVMGALLHIGLKREKFGDILLDELGCQTVIAKEIVEFARSQVTQIHRIPVELVSVPWTQLRPPVRNLAEKSITVASPRLDAVLGEVYHLSRAKALVPIRGGKVKVNWKVVDDPSHLVQAGDVLSLAGMGRCKVLDVSGTTRSGRIRLTVGVFI
jgi:RNA-binding protein YlmH